MRKFSLIFFNVLIPLLNASEFRAPQSRVPLHRPQAQLSQIGELPTPSLSPSPVSITHVTSPQKLKNSPPPTFPTTHPAPSETPDDMRELLCPNLSPVGSYRYSQTIAIEKKLESNKTIAENLVHQYGEVTKEEGKIDEQLAQKSKEKSELQKKMEHEKQVYDHAMRVLRECEHNLKTSKQLFEQKKDECDQILRQKEIYENMKSQIDRQYKEIEEETISLQRQLVTLKQTSK